MDSPRPLKRSRSGDVQGSELLLLISNGRWEKAVQRVKSHPQEAALPENPSPLAVACRGGAPRECVEALLEAAPEKLRHVLDARGTPLHEAIVCENTELNVFAALLKADEALGDYTTRATLLQDVDGFTPLHLLIRRRFQSHVLSSNDRMLEILDMLVRSCPEAVIIPDRGEYEEPPIVYALKADIYAPGLGLDDATQFRMEKQIFEMVRTVLKYAPSAASKVFSGFRGQYSALHSAVFHGRYPSTIELLLRSEEQFPTEEKTALLTNTQSELPLHFCAMRGERPSTVALVARAAPEAINKRDASGLTPFHWIWARYVSTLLSLEDDGRGANPSIVLRTSTRNLAEMSHYKFVSVEQGDFETDLHTIRRLDPPVDFLRMRHIPDEVSREEDIKKWANHTTRVLKALRERGSSHVGDYEQCLTRMEVVVSLFWTKVVSLLETFKSSGLGSLGSNSGLLHMALDCPGCAPPIASVIAALFPEELYLRDDNGRLPIHFAARRAWHNWDWPRGDGTADPPPGRFLRKESLRVLQLAVELSPNHAMRVTDVEKRLVVHYVIEAFVTACSRQSRVTNDCPWKDLIAILRKIVTIYPECLQRRDGTTKLYPFLQATAISTEQQSFGHNELSLSVTFELLRENPNVLIFGQNKTNSTM